VSTANRIGRPYTCSRHGGLGKHGMAPLKPIAVLGILFITPEAEPSRAVTPYKLSPQVNVQR
jgi:hypothetical protein